MNEYDRSYTDDNEYGNTCIGCDVKNCAHHAGTSNYCMLEKINVRGETPVADCPECTQCGSFEKCTDRFDG